MLRRALLTGGAAALVSLVALPARSEPTTKILVGFAAGGTSDVIARVVANSLGQKLGGTVIVENKPGVTGQIAATYVARAVPDGHMLLLASQSSQAVAPSLYKSLPYDPVKDFTPITLVTWSPLVLVCNSSLNVNSVKDLIDYIKKRPGQLSYATGGRADGSHLSALMFNSMAKLDAVAVPFQGDGPALASVLAGQLPYMFVSVPTVASFIATGKIRALAVTSKMRAKSLPDLPTISEAALPGYEMVNWWAIYGPPNMSPDSVKKLNAAIVDVLHSSGARERLEKLGYEVTGGSADELAAYLKNETQKWFDVTKNAGLEAQ
jgi:tripartite-type tricarboxylate transporter receptor subunit TctC